MSDKPLDQHEILEASLQAAAGEYAIVHFERRGDTFRVWPPDNGAPFSVAVVQPDEVERLRGIETRLLADHWGDKDPHGSLGYYLTGEG